MPTRVNIESLIANPYLVTNYIHQEVNVPNVNDVPDLARGKKDFYDRIESYMKSEGAQKALEKVVDDNDHLGIDANYPKKLSTEALTSLDLHQAIDLVAEEAGKALSFGDFYKAVVDANRHLYAEMTKNLRPDETQGFSKRKQEIEGMLMGDLYIFKQGLSNAMDFTFALIGAIPQAFKKLKGFNISIDEFKKIIKNNLKLLNVLCGMQIEILNTYKQNVFRDMKKKERRVKAESFELRESPETNSLSLIPTIKSITELIEIIKSGEGLTLPVFGCPVLRVKYKKDDVPIFEKIHEWIEKLVDKYILNNLDALIANTEELSYTT